ncbi:MAG: response regulator [Prolixibacteraceae bacterium]|nr:response regulator [Prolixibacteraceae bacterium]
MSKVSAFWFFSILILCALLVQSCSKGSKVKTPQVVAGSIDLSHWDFERDGTLKLNGDWEFYWNTFLIDSTPNIQNPASTGYLFVPGLWNNKTINNNSLPGQGYASYRLKIKHNTTEELAIKYLNAATSCAVYIDSVLLYKAGNPSTSKKHTLPSYRPAVITFSPQNGQSDLVLQIANFHHRKGGQWEPLILGTEKQISQLRNRQVFMELFSIGGIFIIALFHLLIYLHHRYEKTLLYFGMFALLISFKFLVSGEFTIYLLGNIPVVQLVRIDYLSFYLAIMAFLFFFKTLFPNEINHKVAQFIKLAAIVFSLSVVLPMKIFSHGVLYFQLIAIVGGIYVLISLGKAIRNRREGSKLFLYGFIMLFVCMVHDIMNENELIYSVSLVPVGLPLFILSQALILSSRIRKALLNNEKLTFDLQQQNEEYLQLNQKYKVQNEQLMIAKEKAEESDRFKSAFLANISHEIRTPMNGILGFAELLSNRELPEVKRSRYLTILKERGHHLLGVINDIIDISRIETGHIDLRIEAVNINALFNELFDSYYHVTEKKQVRLIRKVTLPDSRAMLLTDKQKVRQIMDNLLSNAVKFTRSGEIEFGYHLKAEHRIEFYVRDTGIGLKENEVSKIFDRFNQANPLIANQYGGTGLGLSIVKAYVEKMGGNIQVVSVPDSGSLFHFSLIYNPVQLENPDLNQNQSMTAPKANLMILLIEDNPDNAFLVEELLTEIDARVLHAADGASAYDLFRLNPSIDLVLMDIKLPDTNGYDLTRRLKAIRPAIPVIALTAYALLGDKEKALEAGCSDYLPKPVDSRELYAKISRYTSGLLN